VFQSTGVVVAQPVRKAIANTRITGNENFTAGLIFINVI
jgi:hypothetical protein